MKKWFRYEPLFTLINRAKLRYGAIVSADLAQFTVESMDVVDVPGTRLVRVQAISEMCTRASVLSKRLTKAPNFSIRTTLAW